MWDQHCFIRVVCGGTRMSQALHLTKLDRPVISVSAWARHFGPHATSGSEGHWILTIGMLTNRLKMLQLHIRQHARQWWAVVPLQACASHSHTAGGCCAGAVSAGAGQEDEVSRREKGSEPEKRSFRHPGGIQNLFFHRVAAVPLPVVKSAPKLVF